MIPSIIHFSGRITKIFPLLFLILLGCSDEPIPKPKGYFRIALLEKEYATYESPCGFRMEVPKYALLRNLPGAAGDSCWFNLIVPGHKATIHFTHHFVRGNLDRFLNDAYSFAYKHDVKANAINKTRVRIDSTRVHGLIYDLKGNTATNLQFYLTDSSRHFLRGALYFHHTPNMDSIGPVLQWLRQDVIHLSETLKWE